MKCFRGTNEKLGSVCIGTRVGHAQDSRARVFQLEIFIRKRFAAKNGHATHSIVVRKITSLNHEFHYSLALLVSFLIILYMLGYIIC
jgi:hypothetical protein